jgi:hypothetical protein
MARSEGIRLGTVPFDRIAWFLLPWVAWLLTGAVLYGALQFDNGASLIRPYGIELAKLLVALLALTAFAISPWLGARALPAVAGLTGAASLGVSAALRAGAGSGETRAAYGFAEPAALLWLLLLVALRGQRWWVSGAVIPVLWAAIVLRPISVKVDDTGLIMALFYAVGTTA